MGKLLELLKKSIESKNTEIHHIAFKNLHKHKYDETKINIFYQNSLFKNSYYKEIIRDYKKLDIISKSEPEFSYPVNITIKFPDGVPDLTFNHWHGTTSTDILDTRNIFLKFIYPKDIRKITRGTEYKVYLDVLNESVTLDEGNQICELFNDRIAQFQELEEKRVKDEAYAKLDSRLKLLTEEEES